MAVLHLLVALLYLPWLVLHLLVLLALGQVDGFHAGAPVIGLSLALHGAAWLCLVVAAVGHLRGVRGLRTWNLLYAILATGAALLLWLTGARLWFVLLLLAYPFVVAFLVLRPEVPSSPSGSAPGPRSEASDIS